MLLMNRATKTSLNLGSVRACLFDALFFLIDYLLWPFCAIFRAPLFPFIHSCSVKRSTNDVVTDSWQIFHSSPAYHYNRMLLKIVSFSGYVCSHFNAIRQSHARNLAQRGIRLLGGRGIHARADAPFLRVAVEGWRLALEQYPVPAQSD